MSDLIFEKIVTFETNKAALFRETDEGVYERKQVVLDKRSLRIRIENMRRIGFDTSQENAALAALMKANANG